MRSLTVNSNHLIHIVIQNPSMRKQKLFQTSISSWLQSQVTHQRKPEQRNKNLTTAHELGKNCNFIIPRLINTYQSDNEEVKNKIKSNMKCNVQIVYNPTAMIGYGYKSYVKIYGSTD